MRVLKTVKSILVLANLGLRVGRFMWARSNMNCGYGEVAFDN